MQYQDLRDFIAQLEQSGQLKRVTVPISPDLEMTEICDRLLKQGGPAVIFENPTGFDTPVLGNLFGTTERIALAMGQQDLSGLRELGKMLAELKQPTPPQGLKDSLSKLPLIKNMWDMKPKVVKKPPCQEVVLTGDEIDLAQWPIQRCWPEDAAPLITWGLVTTKGPHKTRQNTGIYRQQVIGRNQLIMRWLAHRGGALDYKAWQKAYPEKPFPIAVSLGADPATMLAAVTPIPDSLSEYAFAGLLRGQKTQLATCLSHDLQIPATAEIILEGFLDGTEAPEGPYGDHTGYYNEVEKFPVFTVTKLTHRHNPIYHSTYTGKPPDEPAMLGVALNEVLIPILQQQFPEIADFYLPPEGCSYRMAVVTMKKAYAGHAKRVMLGVWSFLTQFMYTKFIIVTDDDVDARNWQDVIWALTTRVDPRRDMTILDNTPIDYLDFASPISGLGSKLGIDATHKWSGETTREWGRTIHMDPAVQQKIDTLWQELGL